MSDSRRGLSGQGRVRAEEALRGLGLGLLVLAGCMPGDGVALDGLQASCPAAADVVDPGLPTRTNLLIVSIDTLRRDAVGVYGGGDSPFLDGLVSSSVLLDDHVSGASWTMPSMMCAMAGRCGEEMGVVPDPDRVLYEDEGLPEGEPALWTWLAAAGMQTAAVAPSPMLTIERGLSRDVGELHLDKSANAQAIVDTGLGVVDDLMGRGQPWALQLHFNDVHSPYQPPAAYLSALDDLDPIPWDLDDSEASWLEMADSYGSMDRETQQLVVAHMRARYAGALTYLDDQLARLWGELEARGALDDTLVVVFSDHGEQFYEHGQWSHNRSLHVEERSSFALFWADGIAPAVVGQPTHHRDLVPTLFPAIGVPVPLEVTGTRIGDPPPLYRTAITRPVDEPPVQAVDYECLTLHYTWSGDVALYRRDHDPSETEAMPRVAWAAVLGLLQLLEEDTQRAAALIDSHEPLAPHR